MGFSHPAVPAYNLPEQDQISVPPAKNPYLDFFKWPKEANKTNRFNPQWVPSLMWGLEKLEVDNLPKNADRWEHFRFDLEAIANTTSVIKTIRYSEDMTQLSPEDQTILFNADHSVGLQCYRFSLALTAAPFSLFFW